MNPRMRRVMAIGTILVLVMFLATTFAHADSKEADRAKIRTMARDVLAKLYKKQPSARDAIARAAGYAVFSNTGMKILITGGGRGKGVAVRNSTKQETFMKMIELQAGLGFGVKKFQLIWVFETEQAFDQFVESGWEFGGQATAAAKTGSGGGSLAGAVSISPGVWLYQLTEKGLALELTAKGTKYYKDDDLNSPGK
jgi:lipid-binding SYLF domain-containing protein